MNDPNTTRAPAMSRFQILIQELFCLAFCGHHKAPKPRVKIGVDGITITFFGDFTMDVKDTSGPFTLNVSNFVDSKGNPTTDADIPVYSSDDAGAFVTLSANPADAQGQIATLTGKIGQANLSATFGDPAAGGFVVTGVLNVLPGAAVSATMGIVDSSAPVAAARR